MQSCVVPTAKDVLLKVFGATTMSDMQHVVKRDEATKVREIQKSTTSDTRATLFIKYSTHVNRRLYVMSLCYSLEF